MNLTLCGSITFIREMNTLCEQLEVLGHGVQLPTQEAKPRGQLMNEHYAKIEQSDAIVVANYTKNGVENYIGPSTLIEMAIAFYLRKPIFLLNPIPQISYFEEIVGMNPIIINGNLQQICAS